MFYDYVQILVCMSKSHKHGSMGKSWGAGSMNKPQKRGSLGKSQRCGFMGKSWRSRHSIWASQVSLGPWACCGGLGLGTSYRGVDV